MKKIIKVGLIGCGGIAGRHVDWFLAHPECEIIALCDLSSEALDQRESQIQNIRPESKVLSTQDHHELLAQADLDAVAVLLPHNLHYPVTMDALQADKHVLVEKPMVTDVEHARILVKTAEERDRHICIGYQRSYLSEYAYVRQMIETGELGEIQFISAHLEQSWYSIVASKKANESWRTNAEAVGGGQLVDTGSHTVAALLDVTQLVPEEVFAFVDKKDLSVDVNTAAVVRFTSGALATLCVGGFGHKVTEVLRVVGSKKSTRIFFRTVLEQTLEVDGEIVDAKGEISSSTPNANFVNAILGRESIQANAQLGLRVVQLSEAVYISAKENRPVTINNLL